MFEVVRVVRPQLVSSARRAEPERPVEEPVHGGPNMDRARIEHVAGVEDRGERVAVQLAPVRVAAVRAGKRSGRGPQRLALGFDSRPLLAPRALNREEVSEVVERPPIIYEALRHSGGSKTCNRWTLTRAGRTARWSNEATEAKALGRAENARALRRRAAAGYTADRMSALQQPFELLYRQASIADDPAHREGVDRVRARDRQNPAPHCS